MARLVLRAEALAALALASILIAALPFRHVARLVARGTAVRPIDVATARAIDRALQGLGRRVPWHAMCFQQGLAACLMLRRRGYAATLHYGAAHGEAGDLVAHVWVTSGGVAVVGCDGSERYAQLAIFPPPTRA